MTTGSELVNEDVRRVVGGAALVQYGSSARKTADVDIAITAETAFLTPGGRY